MSRKSDRSPGSRLGAAPRAYLALSADEAAFDDTEDSRARKLAALVLALLVLIAVPLLWAAGPGNDQAMALVGKSQSGPGGGDDDDDGDDNQGTGGGTDDSSADNAASAATAGTGSRDSAQTAGTTANTAETSDDGGSADSRGTGSRNSARSAGTTRGTRGGGPGGQPV